MEINDFEASPEDVAEQRSDPVPDSPDPEHPVPATESGRGSAIEADPADVAEQDEAVAWPDEEDPG